MEKVLIIGPKFYGYNQSIANAFSKLGYTYQVIEYLPGEVASLKEKFIYHTSRNKQLFFAKQEKKFNDAVLKIYHEFKPELVFIVQGNQIHKHTLEQMQGAKKVLWMMDSIFRAAGAFKIRHDVDAIFLFEKTDVAKLWEEEKIQATFLPLALDETVYYPKNKSTEIDILFIGALYQKRIDFLSAVVKRFPGKVIKIYGRYYAPLRRPGYHFKRKDKHIFLNKNITPEKVNDLYNQSRICINIHHDQSKYGVNQRFFEISGSKSFQLVDTNPYIDEYFTPHEMVTYTNLDNLLDKIEQVFSGTMDTKEPSENAYQKILSNHTFTHRIKDILVIINAQSKHELSKK